jgi:predicted nucleic-acid-binding protein
MGRKALKITADTNVLLRSVLQDDPYQGPLATKTLNHADLIAIPLPVLCEYVWVLRRTYKESSSVVADSIERLLSSPNIAVNKPAVEAGLATLRAGGDFADGVVAHEGQWLGAETFLTFDAKAVTLLNSQGIPATLLS